jgi:hypothetical protein
VLSQICLAHVGGDTQEHICVEGILHWIKEEGGHITSVDRATREEGALSLGRISLLGTPKLSMRSCYCIRFYYISLLVVFTT